MFCAWLAFDYLGRKRVIHFHVQPYSTTFRNRKDCKRFSRLSRRRESVATWRISRTKTICTSKSSKILISHCPQSCVAKSPRDCARMGLVSTRKLVDIMPSFMPCHVAVCVNSILGAKVLTFSVISQSTGLTFPTSSLARDDFYKC